MIHLYAVLSGLSGALALFAAVHPDAGELRRLARRRGVEAVATSLVARGPGNRRERLAAADAATHAEQPIEMLRALVDPVRSRERELATRAVASAQTLAVSGTLDRIDAEEGESGTVSDLADRYGEIAHDARMAVEVRAMADAVHLRLAELGARLGRREAGR